MDPYKLYQFTCQCGRAATSKFADVKVCVKCRAVKHRKYCQTCNKQFYSKSGKLKCRACIELTNDYTELYLKNKTARALKNICNPVGVWEKEIKLLYVKVKHDLLSPVDPFKIAHIYIDVTCNYEKHCSLSVQEQCRIMITELLRLLQGQKITTRTRKPKTKKVRDNQL